MTGRRRRLWLVALLVITLSGLALASTTRRRGPAAPPQADKVVLQWNEAALDGVRQSRLGPPMVARALAVVHTCMYDAWAAYDPIALGTRLGGQLRRPVAERSEANKAEALSYAAYRAATDLFPDSATVFADLMRQLAYDPSNNTTDRSTPAGVGNVACGAVLDFRHHDGSNQLGELAPGPYSDYTGYAPVNDPDTVRDPNRWQLLRLPDGQGGVVVPGFVAPHWYRVTPFALTSGSQFRSPTGPARYPSDVYRAQAQRVVDMSANLTDREKAVAEYWADGPKSELPPGHWNLFAQFVSRRDGHSVDQAVKLFFALNNAGHDAAISAWDNKRHFDSVRPITAVRFLFKGQQIRAWAGPHQGTRLIDGGEWKPYQPDSFITPPFSEYTSGHSTFSAAAAEVLERFTGGDQFGYSVIVPIGSSRVEPRAAPAEPVQLGWATFTEAADEAGMSRLYGGIHFEQGDLDGRAQGRLVGAQAWAQAQHYFTGGRTGRGQAGSCSLTCGPGAALSDGRLTALVGAEEG
ncbi:MAG: vanadium-dependent haloperoxidase [Actinomycetota bacterium]|nr:vanadium-dependent haloperoxidase [Actinomycetota bacterium]